VLRTAVFCRLPVSVIIENRVYSANGQEHWMQFANHGFFDSGGHLVEIQSMNYSR